MIEMLGVLAIIGVLSIGGLAGYQKAMRMNKINTLLRTRTAPWQNFKLRMLQDTSHRQPLILVKTTWMKTCRQG